MSSEEHEILKEISRKLDVLIGFAATVGRDPDAQVDVLTSLGYGPAFIGPLIGLTPNAVSLRVFRRNKTGTRNHRKKNAE
jgi:hypothetical protein